MRRKAMIAAACFACLVLAAFVYVLWPEKDFNVPGLSEKEVKQITAAVQRERNKDLMQIRHLPSAISFRARSDFVGMHLLPGLNLPPGGQIVIESNDPTQITNPATAEMLTFDDRVVAFVFERGAVPLRSGISYRFKRANGAWVLAWKAPVQRTETIEQIKQVLSKPVPPPVWQRGYP